MEDLPASFPGQITDVCLRGVAVKAGPNLIGPAGVGGLWTRITLGRRFGDDGRLFAAMGGAMGDVAPRHHHAFANPFLDAGTPVGAETPSAASRQPPGQWTVAGVRELDQSSTHEPDGPTVKCLWSRVAMTGAL